MANNTNWLNISSQSGSSGQTILTLSANKNLSTNYKTAEITAYNPVYNISAKTYVTLESYAPILSISPDLFGVPDSGGTYELTISANCTWVIAFPDLVTSYSTSAGTGNAVVTFTVPGTTADTTLAGNIVVTDESGQISRTARVEQYGSGVHIGVFPVELYFDSTGGSQTFSVTADAAYNVSVGSGTDWAFVEPNSGYTGQTTFTVTVNSENTGTTDKQGVINIDAPGQDLAVILYHKKPETRLIVGYYVTSTTDPTVLMYSGALSSVSQMEYPDGTQITPATAYTFPSTGMQYVYYTLTGDTIPQNMFNGTEAYMNDKETIREVYVPEGVTSIAYGAFRDCFELTAVTLPDGLLTVGEDAFRGCIVLPDITFPEGLLSIGARAFDSDYELHTIVIPSSVTGIGGYAFTASSVSSITFNSLTPPTLGNTDALTSSTLSEIIVPCPAVNDYITAWPQYAQYISCSETGTTLYFTTDTSNVKGTGETRTITILNTNINPNRTGLNLPSDFPQQGSYIVDGNVIYLTYPRNPSSSATRNWTIGVVGMTKDGVSLSGSYNITQNANVTYAIPYTADTSTVDASGETRTITIDTTGLIASSITIGIEGATGISYTYNNGVITITFPENESTPNNIIVSVDGKTTDGDKAESVITYNQEGGDLSSAPLKFKITSSGTIYWKANNSAFTRTIQYKKNKGNWTSITSNTGNSAPSISVSAGDVVQFRGNNATYGIYSSPYILYVCFGDSTAKFEVEGNIMSLIDSTNFATATTLASSYTFHHLFTNCTGLTSAENLLLPATTLALECYGKMFRGCTNLTTAPVLPATTLANSCYSGLFYGCTSLTQAPELPATTLADSCYYEVFRGCTSLTQAPELPATTLVNACYHFMFSGCTSLTSAPELPATTLVSGCYNGMFGGCTSLTQAPELPATAMEFVCYQYMFQGCTSLTTAPALPATTLANNCYEYMFQGCTSLTTAPELPATTLVAFCYGKMFQGCTSLNFIKCLATDISAGVSVTICTQYWVENVATTGTFVKDGNMNDWTTGVDGIPEGWSIREEGTISYTADTSDVASTGETRSIMIDITQIIPSSITVSVEGAPGATYSYNNAVVNVIFPANIGNAREITVVISGVQQNGHSASAIIVYTQNATNTATGMTLILNDAIANSGEAIVSYSPESAIVSLVYSSTDTNVAVIDQNGNIQVLADGTTTITVVDLNSSLSVAKTITCRHINISANEPLTFQITSNGDIRWTTFWNQRTIQYKKNDGVWTNITSKTGGTAPSISVVEGDIVQFKATGNTDTVYGASFSGSTAGYKAMNNIMSLLKSTGFETAVTISSSSALSYVFANTYVTDASDLLLPATTLANECYSGMFKNCSSLTQAPELPATTLKRYCYGYMFSGCTSLVASPELPATGMLYRCYNGMFSNCTSLTQAPELPATTLEESCYEYMFSGCTNLSAITCLATDITATRCTNSWLYNVAAAGTITTPSTTQWATGANGIPSGWTRVNSDT